MFEEHAIQYHREGFSVIKNFASDAEVVSMKTRMMELIEKWNLEESRGSIFSTDPNEKHINNDYFLGSAETVRFFFEPDAVDSKSGDIRTDIPKDRLINKVGHALHILEPVFQDYSFSQKVKDLVSALGYTDPVLPQSMYIFKQPGIGGVVTSHQDSTFLHTEPRLTCLGLWLALDSADTHNGCLWVRPSSHSEPLRRKFARTGKGTEEAVSFVRLFDDPSVPWEGALPPPPPDATAAAGPEPAGPPAASAGGGVMTAAVGSSVGDSDLAAVSGGSMMAACSGSTACGGDAKERDAAARRGLEAAGFVPVPARPGDLVFFSGTLDHLSLPNLSDRPRHTFQLHLVEGPLAGVSWSASNWLQYAHGRPFPSLR